MAARMFSNCTSVAASVTKNGFSVEFVEIDAEMIFMTHYHVCKIPSKKENHCVQVLT